MTFELPDSEQMCFYDLIDRGIKCTLEFQVITGGNFDVDVKVTSSDGTKLYSDTRKQFDTFTFTTEQRGEFSFCFSNEFSTFTHKVVYFELVVGDDDPMKQALGNHITALTQMEVSAERVHENLKSVQDYQTHHRLRESQGKASADDLTDRVHYWSFGQTLIILLVGVGQVLVLRGFFTDRSGMPLDDRRYHNNKGYGVKS